MGITLLCAQMLLHEHKYRPIKGRVVTIGRQSVDLSGDEMDRLLDSMNIKKRPGAAYAADNSTVETFGKGRTTITQESFFGAFSDASILCLDVNPYEKADLVCDLQARIPWRYRNYADLVFDGSCLDNIFDPAAAMRNISLMLKRGGRFLAMNTGGPNPAAYLKFSPDWFMDFCAANNYADCKVYIAHLPNTVDQTLEEQRLGKLAGRSSNLVEIYNFNPYVVNAGGPGYDSSMIETSARYQIFCIGEKGAGTNNRVNPIQKHYRTNAAQKAACLTSARRFIKSPRPLFSNGSEEHAAALPRIDSSIYPEQLRPIAVINQNTVDKIAYLGAPAY